MCVRLILVLVLGRQTVYGQKTVYPCLSTYIVFENTHTHSNVPHWLRANRQREATRRQQDTTQAREARCVCVYPSWAVCVRVSVSVLRALVGCKKVWLQKRFHRIVIVHHAANRKLQLETKSHGHHFAGVQRADYVLLPLGRPPWMPRERGERARLL